MRFRLRESYSRSKKRSRPNPGDNGETTNGEDDHSEARGTRRVNERTARQDRPGGRGEEASAEAGREARRAQDNPRLVTERENGRHGGYPWRPFRFRR